MGRKGKTKTKWKAKDRSRRNKTEGRSCGRDWAGLDRDVLVLIFLKLGTLEVLRVAGAVCRSWRRVATEEPEIWRKIDMASHDYGFEAFALMDPTRVAIDRGKGRVEELYLDYLGDDDLLRYLCDRTSVLKKLCLLSCWQVSQNGIAETAKRQPLLEDLEITIGSFEQNVTEVIGRECPQLKSLRFNTVWYNSPNFTEFLQQEDNGYDEVLGLPYNWYNLPEFRNFRGFSDSDDDDDVEDDDDDDDDAEAVGIANNLHELHNLHLIGDDDDDEEEEEEDDDAEALGIANNLHELHNLHLIGDDDDEEEEEEEEEEDDDAEALGIANNLHELHNLHLIGDDDDEEEEEEDDLDAEALGIANHLHELRHLQLVGNRMTNRGLKAILDGCPHLETLDIRRCRNLKINGEIWSRCARLKTVRLPEDSVDDYPYEADNDHDIMM